MLLETGARPVVAHRGASGEFPENTILAFRNGLDQGADALEFDVRLSADGVPVVIHDPWVDRTTDGTGQVSELALSELRRLDAGYGESIPTVDQVLAEFTDCPMIIEIKETPAAAPLAEVVRRHGAQGRALFGSFLGGALKPVRAREFARAASRTESAIFWLASRMGIGAGSRAFEAFTVPVKHRQVTVVDRRFVLAAVRQGKPVHVWTVDDRAEAERLRSLGVEGIITNYPARMRGLCA